MLIGKSILKAVDDSKAFQLIKVSGLAGQDPNSPEVQEAVERIQNYGLSTNPPRDSEVVLAHVGGNKDHPIALVIGHASSRKKGLREGEVCLYDRHGKFIYLREDGTIQINSPNINVEFRENGKILLSGKDGVDLVGLLDTLLGHLITAKAITGIGVQPLAPDTITNLTQVRTELSKLKT